MIEDEINKLIEKYQKDRESIDILQCRFLVDYFMCLYEQEKEKNKNLIKQLQEQNIEIQDISKQLREKEEEDIKMRAKFVLSLANYISKDKIRAKMEEIMNYTYISREERQQQNYAYDRLKELLGED